MEYVITFKNTNYAIKAEQCLLKGNFHVNVMPLPSEIRAGCGICLRMAAEETQAAIKILADNNIEQAELFSRVKDVDKFVYSQVEGGSILWGKN